MTDRIKELETALKNELHIYFDGDYGEWALLCGQKEEYALAIRASAQAHLNLLKDIEADKVKIVPVEPTEDMIDNMVISTIDLHPNQARTIYQWALDEAPDYFTENKDE